MWEVFYCPCRIMKRTCDVHRPIALTVLVTGVYFLMFDCKGKPLKAPFRRCSLQLIANIRQSITNKMPQNLIGTTVFYLMI